MTNPDQIDTKEKAILFSKSDECRKMDLEQRAIFQLHVPGLRSIMPCTTFYSELEKILDRPIMNNEFANPQQLISEFEAKQKSKIDQIENPDRMENPDQIIINGNKFKSNGVILYILKMSKLRRDDLLDMDFSIEDKNQFAQLTGIGIDEYLKHPQISKNAKFRVKVQLDIE